MARKELTDKISIYIPQTRLKQRSIERLIKLGEKRDRSINYIGRSGDYGISRSGGKKMKRCVNGALAPCLVVRAIVFAVIMIALVASIAFASEWIVDAAPAVGDYNSIWDAILMSAPGDVIRVNPGVYQESNELMYPLTIIGSSEGEALIIPEGEFAFRISASARGTEIRGLVIRGADVRSQGIVLDETENVTIIENMISQCAEGITLRESSQCSIQDNSLHDNTRGIELSESSDNHIAGNICIDNYLGIVLGNSSSNVISMNKLERNHVGIVGWDVDDNQITANLLIGNAVGISIDGDGNVISANEARGNGTGIGVADGSSNHIIANVVSENSDGIEIGNETGTLIENNECWNNINGISVWRSRASSIINNSISGNCDNGLNLWESPDSEIRGNTIQSNYGTGLNLGDSSSCVVIGNSLTGNRFAGIIISGTSSDVTIEQNNISGNTRFGLVVWTDAGRVNAQNNWWGFESGPYQEESHRSGLGDEIDRSSTVFRPWLKEPVSTVAAPCDCGGPDLNCDDFATQQDAQTCYDYCLALGYSDIFHLEEENDKQPCQALL